MSIIIAPFLAATCNYHLQSDKYREYCFNKFNFSLLLNLRLKRIYFKNSGYFEKEEYVLVHLCPSFLLCEFV